MQSLLACFAAIGLAFAPWGRVRAAPPEAPEQEAALHFERGVDFYREGSLDAALVEFERAYDLRPHYRVLFNLAQIQAERHEYTAAIELFERYLQEGGSDIPESRRAEASSELEKLKGRVAQLWVESDVAGAKLFVNGALAGELPLAEAVPINPGVSNLRLEKAGYETAVTQVRVASGERPKLRLPLLRSASVALDDSVPHDATKVTYTPLWACSAAAVALGGTTLTFGLLWRSASRDLDAELAKFPANEQDVSSARSRLKLYAGLTDGAAVATVLALGLSIYFAVNPPAARPPSRKEGSGKTVRVLPSARGLALHGTF